jgi:hypothetical protein
MRSNKANQRPDAGRHGRSGRRNSAVAPIRIERWCAFGLAMSCSLVVGCGKPDAERVAPPAATNTTGAASSNAARPLAAEIVAFQKKRDACDHFRGEAPYDAERAKFLAAQLAENCAGTDRLLADLRSRYANDADALAALKGYEDKIE